MQIKEIRKSLTVWIHGVFATLHAVLEAALALSALPEFSAFVDEHLPPTARMYVAALHIAMLYIRIYKTAKPVTVAAARRYG